MKNLSASLSTCLHTLFPKNHIALHLFWGLCLSLSHLLPHPDWLSKDTLLVIQGVCVVLLCILTLALYLTHSVDSGVWWALGYTMSGLFFLALSGIDWLTFDSPPIVEVLIGSVILLVKFICAFKRVTQEGNAE